MGLIQFDLPGRTSQPQGPVPLNPKWVRRGLVAAINAATPRAYGATAIGGTPQIVCLQGGSFLGGTVAGLTLPTVAFNSEATIVFLCNVQGSLGEAVGGLGTSGSGTQLFSLLTGSGGNARGLVRTVDAGGISTAEFPVSNYSNVATTAVVYNGTNQVTVYRSGVDVTSTRLNTAASGAFSGINNFSINAINRGTDIVAAVAQRTAVGLAFNQALTAQEIAYLSANIWDAFAPRRIWVPVSAGGGGDATIALPSAAATSATGTVSATGSAVVTLPSAAGTSAAGTVSAVGGAAVTLPGAQASAATGTVSATGSAVVTLASAAASAAVGTVSASSSGAASVTLPSAAATAATGAVSAVGSAVVALTSAAATAAVGTVSASTSASASVTLASASATASAGSITATGSAQIILPSAWATAAVGTVYVGELVVLAEYRRFASPFATLRQAGSAITQTVTLASAIDLE